MLSLLRRWFGPAQAPAVIAAQDPADDERRAWPRYRTELHGTALSAGADTRVRARVCDLSRGGARLVVDTRFDIGQILSLELHAKNGAVRTILASVVRVVPCNDGTWSLGCIFSLELSDGELGIVGARKLASSGKDRRIWVRFACDARAAYRKFGEPASESQPVKVLNLSASGIGLLMHSCLERDVMLNLDLFDRNMRKVCGIIARVVRATMHTGKAYALGCRFIRELTDEELEALL